MQPLWDTRHPAGWYTELGDVAKGFAAADVIVTTTPAAAAPVTANAVASRRQVIGTTNLLARWVSIMVAPASIYRLDALVLRNSQM